MNSFKLLLDLTNFSLAGNILKTCFATKQKNFQLIVWLLAFELKKNLEDKIKNMNCWLFETKTKKG